MRRLAQFANIRTRDEGLVAGSRQNDAAHPIVVSCVLEDRPQIGPGRRIQRIEHLGAVNNNARNTVALLVKNVRKRERGRSH